MSRRFALFHHVSGDGVTHDDHGINPGVLNIVNCRTELGFVVANRPPGLFSVDAWRLSEGATGGFGRGCRTWQQHPALAGCESLYAEPPTLLAEFDADSNWLGVEDAAGATGALARYVGLEYDQARWRSLDPDEYRVALLAGVSCTSCCAAASTALANATNAQLEAITHSDVTALMSHPHGPLRLATIRLWPKIRNLGRLNFHPSFL
ncbi:hypothetical protein [Longimicrobium terrae]|uniref:Uncharacterized protein n=1 Tax=Longimicrobium terrae TaxID=1639882 RepID=A0A841GWB0_9BACT|nr:hypothetical protein [Longimicrobium terrae]MBB4635650.1 hypothetical protein [Longimicrobium terrae]MBB6070044.1 hypothetical protein [Longimicrobium terrae]NNC32950.1 hypothetical protein [Longimicrobium terrae]